MQTNPTCSVVIPVYNSQESLPELIRQLLEIMPAISSAFEIILVNDGSRDQSWSVIQNMAQLDTHILGINLMRNYGQHNALLCGLREARYGITITMDDDLQHPPKEIPHLLKKLTEDSDVVYGVPYKLPHSIWRNLLSRLTKIAMANAMGIKSIKDISAFRALRTDLRNAFANYQSPNVLFDVLLSWGTTQFTAVKVDLQPRFVGRSNYNFLKLFNQTMLIITGFSTAPLRIASLIGFFLTIIGIFILFYIVGRYLIEGSLPGFPFLASIITIFSGAQLFALGVIGEYIARIFARTIERPTYAIKEYIKKVNEPVTPE